MSVNTISSINAFLKEVYGDNILDVIPHKNNNVLVKNVPFNQAEMLGSQYVVPVALADEQGVTYAGALEDDFTLNGSVANASERAVVQGAQIVVEGSMGYKAAAAARGKDAKAFVASTRYMVERMMKTMTKRLEVQHLYGGSGLAQIDGSTNVSATETTVDITAATFAPGIWIGSKNALIDVYNGASQVGSDSFTVKSFDYANKTLTLTGASGDITALDSAFPATLDLWFKGAKGKESLGLDQIITTSGTLFGIDNTVNDLWKGQTYAVGGALNFDKITEAANITFNYGNDDKLVALVSPVAFQGLINDEAALREYDKSYNVEKAQKGNKALEFNVGGISIELKQHPMVKQGEAFLVPMDKLKRVGARKESLKTPGLEGEDIFRQKTSSTGYEMRAYTDQALFCECPSHLVKMTGIS